MLRRIMLLSISLSVLFSVASFAEGSQLTIAGESVNFTSTGNAQESVYVLRNIISGGTPPTELFLDGTAQRITVAMNSTMTFDILIAAETIFGESAGYQISGVIKNAKNAGGATALVGTVTKRVLGEDNPAWDAEVLADNANDALVVRVTGSNSWTTFWVATVRAAHVWF